MTSKLVAFMHSAGVDADQMQDALIKDLAVFLKSDYSRSSLGNTVGAGANEQLDPNVENPSVSDIGLTVHIIALIQSKLAFIDFREASGYYAKDFNYRAKLVHALRNEQAILAGQVAFVDAADAKVAEFKQPMASVGTQAKKGLNYQG